MIFSSFFFLSIFLPIVLLVNSILSIKLSNIFLLVASLFFYFVGEGVFTILLVISILWNYSNGLLLSRFAKNISKSKQIVTLNILGNLSLLFYYKYFEFFVKSLGYGEYMNESSYHKILLPIGISFFTFQGISYIVDLYRKDIATEKSIVKMGLYIAFFPQLIAGPILKYKEIAGYLTNRKTTINTWTIGSFKLIRGLFKKIVLADNFALISDTIFHDDVSVLPWYIAWLGLICYALQIYFDFSGYSDIAIGLGRMMGFRIPENFNLPYISKSIQEFWRRWHISLSTWFKEYLYIPLGGNKKGVYRTYFNLFVVFFITGLWHGASYNFIIWGLCHGLFMVLERLSSNSRIKVPSIIRHIYVLIVVVGLWVFFRTETLTDSYQYIKWLLSFKLEGDKYALLYFNPYNITLMLIAIAFAFGLRKFINEKTRPLYNKLNKSIRINFRLIGYMLVLVYCLTELAVSSHSPFIYFKF